MPPKRKAASTSEQAPPPKRTTRSRGPLEETQPVVVVERPRKRGRPPGIRPKDFTPDAEHAESQPETKKPAPRRGRTAKVAKESPPLETEAPPLPKRRAGRVKKVPRAVTETSDASSSKVTLEALENTVDEDDSPDELLLSSPPTSRPSTPVARPPRTSGTPRLVLDAVEITTPSRRMRSHASSPQLSPRKTSSTAPVARATPLKKHSTTIFNSQSKISSPPLPAPLLLTVTDEEDELNTFAPSRPRSPTKAPLTTPASSPRKGKNVATPQTSPSRLPRVLPPHLHASLHAQKRVALRALNFLSVPDEEEEGEDDELGPPTNAAAQRQLSGLLEGTVERGEGNSCLLIGPRGSGKTQVRCASPCKGSKLTCYQLLEEAISALSERPIVVWLSGHVQTNDRLAMREIAWQLAEQTGKSLLPADQDGEDEEENPFANNEDTIIALPPPSHLLALISMIPTLSKPTIIILDGFDLFALHARQALLYCLLDTAQSCRVGAGSKGLAVIGVTTRVDTINMLEKRVKSRFSGRMLRTASPRKLDVWVRAAKTALCTPLGHDDDEDDEDDWSRKWESSVNMFLSEPRVLEVFRETFSLSRDVRLLGRLLVRFLLP